ncbi:uncharacterized protein [Ptychodera flava]|uniref:uncharacterized protein n=1 Tax=Ptychodera flava TaxID=63121 RepID=UPI00396A6DF9
MPGPLSHFCVSASGDAALITVGSILRWWGSSINLTMDDKEWDDLCLTNSELDEVFGWADQYYGYTNASTLQPCYGTANGQPLYAPQNDDLNNESTLQLPRETTPVQCERTQPVPGSPRNYDPDPVSNKL